ncbi:hypothetical protein DFP72DRAFT_877014 [Ephemerocybe angulata]|uniref:DNA replication checkpoint mediator MRC1 domain-containing protein n=1 Tax=Ephemerocybe angulata TaxID=980116 RepID=A0A8H6MEG6_9AGAR|nr:hypothetical protein DFP72DRAFT_877014 [Tulosesus angulatus]
MPLQAEDSVVADSTLSTSPQMPAPTPIKRAPRTYGRKKSPQVQEDASFSSNASPPPASNSSIYRTAPPNLQERIPSTSDHEEENDDPADASDATDTSEAPPRKHGFDLRKQLAAIDREFDEDDDDSQLATKPLGTPGDKTKAKATPSFGFGAPLLLFGDKDEDPASPTPADDIFGGSADRPRPGQSDPAAASSSEGSGPSTHHRKSSGRLVVQDSDSEGEVPTTSPVTNTSPAAPADSTPISRRGTETPPTDSSMANSNARPKGKGRTRSVPPIDFVDATKEGRDKKAKASKPTKRDQVEMIKTSARLNQERQATIHRSQRNSDKFSKRAFLAELTKPTTTEAIANAEPLPSEDVIKPFSSPENGPVPARIPMTRTPSPLPEPIAGSSKRADPDVPALSDDDNVPALTLTDILEQSRKASEAAARKEELKKRKLELLKKQQLQQPTIGDDDDLEVEDLKTPRRTAAKLKLEKGQSNASKPMTRTRQVHLGLAGVKLSKSQPSKLKTVDAGVNREQLDKDAWRKAQREAKAASNQKLEDWKAFGGTVRQEDQVTEGSEEVLRKLAARGIEAADANAERESRMYGESEEDESDGDWNPEERGSASPEPAEVEEAGDEEAEQDVTMGEVEEEAGSLADEEESVDVKVRPGRRQVVASDDEDEEGDENIPVPRPRRRQALRTLSIDDEDAMDVSQNPRLPSEGLSEGGTDKENDDKENRAVVRFAPSGSDDENGGPLLSLDLSERRRPFQEIPGPSDTPKPYELGRGSLTQLFEAQLSGRQRTPEATPGLSLRPLLGEGSARRSVEFSQFSAGETTLLGRSGSSEGDLADLFDATTQRLNDNTWTPKPIGGLGEAFVEKSSPFGASPPKGKSRVRIDSLHLSQDLLAAARPLDIKETQVRKADAVFEKEQEYLLGDGFEPQAKKEKLYVNEYGFLTQTRPNVEDPEIWEPPSPTQGPSGSALETPLDNGSSTLPTPSTTLSFPIESEKIRNAFDVLQDGAEKAERRKNRKIDARAYAIGEAEESDDEGGFWGVKKKDEEDEEDGEDLDRTLEALVDDHEMDDETLAENLVREKFKEGEALADKKAEEMAQAIVDGQRRKRRRNGDLMSEGSDDEDDEDENRRARRKMAKMTKKREDVEALENNPLTKAFAETYKATTEDDDNEFAHLASDDTAAVLDQLMVNRGEDEEDEEENEIEEGGEDETQVEFTDYRQVVKDRLALRGVGAPSSDDEGEEADPTDITWMEEDDLEPEVHVKTIDSARPQQLRVQRGLDPSALDEAFEDGSLMPNKRNDERHQRQGQGWAKREGRNRNLATARSVGAAAVTGLRAKTGGGSLRQSAKGATSGAAGEKAKPPVKKAESILLGKLGTKSARFTS